MFTCFFVTKTREVIMPIFPLCDLVALAIWKHMEHADILQSLREDFFPYRTKLTFMYFWLTTKASTKFISDFEGDECLPDLLSKKIFNQKSQFAELISFCPTCDNKLVTVDKARLESYSNGQSAGICENGCFVCQNCIIELGDTNLCIPCQDKERCAYCKEWDDDPPFQKCSKCNKISCDRCV